MRECITTTAMTDEQIAKAVKLLRQAVKEQPNKFSIKHADPTEQYAYTSSSDLIGIYFPNTQFLLNGHGHYHIACLSMDAEGEYSLMLVLNDDFENEKAGKVKNFYHYFPKVESVKLKDIIYSYEENKIRTAVEQRIKEGKKELHAISKISRVYKKDGTPFFRLDKNFEGARMALHKCWDNTVSRIEFYVSSPIFHCEIDLYLNDNKKEQDITPDEVSSLLEEHKKIVENTIADWTYELKCLHKEFVRAEKLVNMVRNSMNEMFPKEKTPSTSVLMIRDYIRDAIR